jgi:WD40 repeat protein
LEVGGILIRGFDLVWFHVFSRDGQFLAVGSSNGLMRVWDVPRHVLSCQLTNTAPIFVPVAFLDGGRKLLAGAGGSLQEWDLTTASEIQSWPANYLPTSLSPDESLCVTGVRYRDRVQVRNLAEQKTLQLDVGILQTDRSTFSPDGRRFLIASVHGYIQVLDTASWREVATLRGFFWRFRSMAFSPDGKRLVTASSGGQAVQLWDTESWQDVLTIEGQGASHNSTAVSPDGNTIGTLDATGVLQIWRAPSWAEINAAEKTTPASGP